MAEGKSDVVVARARLVWPARAHKAGGNLAEAARQLNILPRSPLRKRIMNLKSNVRLEGLESLPALDLERELQLIFQDNSKILTFLRCAGAGRI